MSLPAFSDIYFGDLSAETEARRNPRLLDEGFFDHGGVLRRLMSEPEFLVLGYKGSGKSAIAHHLTLRAQRSPHLFVTLIRLDDFPYDILPSVVPGSEALAARTNVAWSLLLNLKLFESLMQDESAQHYDPDVPRLQAELEKVRLLATQDLGQLVLASKEINLAVTLPKIFNFSKKQTQNQPVLILSHIRDALRKIIVDAKTDCPHVLIVDGLDATFHLFENHFDVLASLIHEANKENERLDRANSARKIVLLCRTDMFERLPSPNTNKLRDFAIDLDWYRGERMEDSPLIQLATHRARLAGYSGENIVTDYFPPAISVTRREIPTTNYLLERTRRTPRDFLQLLKYIQDKVAPESRSVTQDEVIRGARDYSTGYFVPELKDELAGYLDPAEAGEILHLIGGLRLGEFTFQQLENHAIESGNLGQAALRDALRVLFECSAIGNVDRTQRDGFWDRVQSYRYRNRNAGIDFDKSFVVHRGAWHALNLLAPA